jgi:hypothetical protein
MSRPGPPPHPPANLARRTLSIASVDAGTILYRLHRTRSEPLYFGRQDDPDSRQRWDAPDASYGVCYMAEQDHIAFAETLLRDLRLDAVQETELAIRSLARLHVRTPLRLVAMHGKSLRALGANASVVDGRYDVAWSWSAALYAHADAPDGIRYRARHDDSGFSIALFERARDRVEHLDSVGLLDPAHTRELTRWLGRYDVGLTT